MPLQAMGSDDSAGRGSGGKKWQTIKETLKTPPGKGKGKSKKGAMQRPAGMPAGLKGMHFKTKDGRPICFGYHSPEGCRFGVNCRNVHVCCKPGCEAKHTIMEHDAA